jgi:inhibitor of KinA
MELCDSARYPRRLNEDKFTRQPFRQSKTCERRFPGGLTIATETNQRYTQLLPVVVHSAIWTEFRVPYTSCMANPMANGARFQSASDQSLVVYLGEAEISHDAHRRVTKLLRLLESEPVEGIRNLLPAYCSLLVKFDVLKLGQDELEQILRQYLDRLEEVRLPEPRQLEIPVCYGDEFGPDLNDVASMHRIPPSKVIELHGSADYVAYFLGFVPGFAYLGGLPDALATPRLATPRRNVPSGSVGIAGSQTAVYPLATPGGWRLIGRTPTAMFRPDRNNMSLLSIGDHVRFTPISREQFAALEAG